MAQLASEPREILMARLQAGLVPSIEIPNMRVLARYQSALGMMIGGDFIDAVQMDDGSIAMCCGDVSGHGPDAAALGIRLRVAWRALTFAGISIENVATALSRTVEAEAYNEEIFATLLVGQIDASRRYLTVLSAGHDGPIIFDGPHSAYRVDAARNAPLGVVRENWMTDHIRLTPEFAVLMFSDGVYESHPKWRFHPDPVSELAKYLAEGTHLDSDLQPLLRTHHSADDKAVIGLTTLGLRPWSAGEANAVDHPFRAVDHPFRAVDHPFRAVDHPFRAVRL